RCASRALPAYSCGRARRLDRGCREPGGPGMEVAVAGLGVMPLTASFRLLGAAWMGAALGLGTSARAAAAPDPGQTTFSRPPEAGGDSTGDEPMPALELS